MPSEPLPHVKILLATRNGERFLGEQLASISRQTHPNWSLLVSDDGSTDLTRAIVAEFAAHHPDRPVRWRPGPCQGSTANFLSMLCDPSAAADFVALADQDDIWLPTKLDRALAAARQADREEPFLYGARTIIADPSARPLRQSPLFRRRPDFRNALVQSIAGGNTMVLNRAALALVAAAGQGHRPAAHDWWLYQLVSGAEGRVVYDPRATLLYRQHGANQIGENRSLSGRVRRVRQGLAGRFRGWVDLNLRALAANRDLLAPNSRQILDEFAELRDRAGISALRAFWRAGLYRQSRGGSGLMMAAAMFNRL